MTHAGRGGIHDHADPGETDERTGEVVAVGAEAVEDHAVLADALPDHPRATDLGDGSEGEQQDRAQDRHGAARYLSRVFLPST